jgi:endonuclease/exonuclease/phosphatase family metal-dependent hydrolase
VRIVTINTAKGDGRYACRLDVLARQLQADVVLLREAFAACDRSLSTAAHLGTALDMHVTPAPARRKPRPVEGRELLSDSGLAILSRRPLIDATVRALPRAPADGERIAQIGLVDHPADPVLIVNLHRPGPAGPIDRRLPERPLRRDDHAPPRAVIRRERTT